MIDKKKLQNLYDYFQSPAMVEFTKDNNLVLTHDRKDQFTSIYTLQNIFIEIDITPLPEYGITVVVLCKSIEAKKSNLAHILKKRLEELYTLFRASIILDNE
ncbi:hypothetical protein [Pedobacter cryoconitis]|uniref:Uncharacterized protein n=1 Tax=Pedobacter cryoconitis TaxID=188932 RepID=A0A327S5P7_9SPHI|nr:hypothetical protein [Pedobacter cryoconitis]RAJ22883.1 hypothetical protein LY11_04587 [Pedobacter cryoconitis]